MCTPLIPLTVVAIGAVGILKTVKAFRSWRRRALQAESWALTLTQNLTQLRADLDRETQKRKASQFREAHLAEQVRNMSKR